jgi:hypothetical protein
MLPCIINYKNSFMKTIITILKYYLYGFVIAAGLGFFFFIYGLYFDEAYALFDFILYLKVTIIMALPCGLHLWITEQLDGTKSFQNKYKQLLFIILAHYWMGCIGSFLLLSMAQLIAHIASWDYLYYFIEDNILSFITLPAIPLALLLYFSTNALQLKKKTLKDAKE